jgi:aminopeptidase-like protein
MPTTLVTPTSLADLRAAAAVAPPGVGLHAAMADLFPICRSITGDGVRATLRYLQRIAPIDVSEVPSGTPVFDWHVPREWNIREAWIANRRGERIVDFRANTLHVMSYSIPVRRTMPRGELLQHLHSLPEQPDLIPYRTSYYKEAWAFCVTHRLLDTMQDDDYEVCIDATLTDGSLTYGECVIRGETEDEVLLSTHICHPSMCNDNLSAVVIAALLARQLAAVPLRYTYRFLFIPGTIGAVTWLASNESRVSRIRHGVVLTGLGDEGPFTYKQSRRGDAEIDRLVEHVLRHGSAPWQVRPFSPYGYDERQFCSPGFNLPVGRLSRSPHGEFPQYHTSADNLEFVTPAALARSHAVLLAIIEALEHNRCYRNTNPKCEPQLGRRGLYGGLGAVERGSREMALLWTLNQCDGATPLLDIADRAGMPFDAILEAARALEQHGLLVPCDAT